jgi:nitrite reductase/ring-hydroxylating ferredoxin subunit
VLRKRLMDEDVVIYRTKSGTMCAVRPYCPHLGAHLGMGGKVVGENLVCPYHNFAFAIDGRCVDSPDGVTIRGRVLHYEVRQHHGMVFVWHSDDASPPTWEIPEVAGVDVVSTATWTMDVPTHPQEIVENTADFRHILPVHHLKASVEAPYEADGPFFRSTLGALGTGKGVFKVLGGTQNILLAGLGYVLVELNFPRVGLTARFWGLTTPIGPWETRMHIATAISRRGRGSGTLIDALITRLVLRAVVRIQRQDISIWKYKKYNPKPYFAPGEESLGMFRRWARQFYSVPNPATE